MDITGKVALITGAAAGIGRATAIALANKGAATITLADLDETGLDETAALVEQAGARAISIPTDVTNIESQEALFARVEKEAGGLDILYNNAGLASSVPQFPEMSLARISALCDVNLKGVMLGTRLGIGVISRRGGGVIVNTASIAARAEWRRGDIRHHEGGGGVLHPLLAQLTESTNIRFNCVCPGITDTPMLAKTGDGSTPAAWLAPALAKVELISAGTIAAAVVDLIEDDGKNDEVVTVQNKPVDPPA